MLASPSPLPQLGQWRREQGEGGRDGEGDELQVVEGERPSDRWRSAADGKDVRQPATSSA